MAGIKQTKIFCPIDTNDLDHALMLITRLKDLCGIKLGLEFFNSFGLAGLDKAIEAAPDAPFFFDFKYHDIPNTVAGAVKAITTRYKPAYTNIHAGGGPAMMQAARQACDPATRLLGVTVLTSVDAGTLAAVGQGNDPKTQVERLAMLSQQAELDGVVCSAHEIGLIRAACGDDFVTMVPGIRPAGSDQGDQKRVMTPQDAMREGATHLVIGRPITQADNPAKAAEDILNSI